MTNNGLVLTKTIASRFKTLEEQDNGHLISRGKFTSDNMDEIGDIITRSATERAIPQYKLWGNIRYMHLPQPVGKVLRIGADDGLEWNEVEFKVTEPDAVRQVRDGLLTALSVGIWMTFEDIEITESGGWVIHNYTLTEISLVDHPANYDAKLDLSMASTDFLETARREGMMVAIRTFGMPKVKSLPAKEKSPECRQEGESKQDCVSRKIAEILAENPEMEQDQAVAIANDMCSQSCEDKSMETQEDKLMAQTDETLEAAKEVVSEETVVQEEVVEEVAEEVTPEVEAQDEPEEEQAPEEEPADEPEEEEEAAEVETEVRSISDLYDLLNSINAKLDKAAPAEAPVEVQEELPLAQDDGEVEAVVEVEVNEDQEWKAAMSAEIAALKAAVDELTKARPASRKAAVTTEEIVEETVEETDEPVEEEEHDLKSGIQRYLTTKGHVFKK